MTAYELSMTGTFLPIFGILLSSHVGNYLLTAGIGFVGLLFSLSGLVFSLTGTKEAQDMHWNFLALTVVYAGVLIYCVYGWRKSKLTTAEKLARARQSNINEADVVLPSKGCAAPGACWFCGKPGAPLRTFRLTRVIVLPIAVAGEFVDASVPLCEVHPQHMHRFPHWVRMLSGPFMFLLFVSPLILFGDSFERHSKFFRQSIMITSLVVCVGLYFYLLRWANRTQGFRLRSLNGERDIMTVRFANVEIARNVRRELDEMANVASTDTDQDGTNRSGSLVAGLPPF